MPRIRLVGLALVALGGAALGACELFLGIGDRDTPGTGGGSQMGGGGMGSSGTDAGAGTGGEGGPPSIPGVGIWSTSFAGASVASIAVGPAHAVYLTGSVTGPTTFGCKTVTDAGDAPDAGAGTGFLVQLDGLSGDCTWGFFFGGGAGPNSAQGTGVAVDDGGNVALTGWFTGALTITPTWSMMATMTDSFVAVFDDTPVHKPTMVLQIGDAKMMPGDQKTTGIAVKSGTIAVSGFYTNSLTVIVQPPGLPPMYPLPPAPDPQDAFTMWFDGSSAPIEVGVTSSSPSMVKQAANSVSLDTNGNVALAGTAVGPTMFTGQPPDAVSSLDGNIFLTSYKLSSGANFNTILGGGLAQHGVSVAFDSANDVLVGGDFTGPVGVVDGGAAYTSSGTSVLVARYDATGKLLGSFQLGSDTTTATVTIANVAPWPVPGFSGGASTAGPSVAFGGSFSGATAFIDGGTLVGTGSNPTVYVAKVDPTLVHVLWARSFGDGVANAVAVDPMDGTVLVAGQFDGMLAFKGKTSTLNSQGANDLFVAKLTP